MKKKTKQIMAWIIIVILVLLYVSTLVFALIRAPWAKRAFGIAIANTILLPILFYLIVFFTRLLTPAQMPQEMQEEEESSEESVGKDEED